MSEILDCLVVGGGPGGLTAGIYLGRFRRTALVVDAGGSRAAWIPRSRNLPGFPQGVEGPVLLERMADQVRRYGVELRRGRVEAIAKGSDGLFTADLDGERLRARNVILATGVVEIEPDLPHVIDAVRRGVIRICPICDAYEAIDKRIAIVGVGEHAAREALFLRTYSRDVTLLRAPDAPPLAEAMLRQLEEAEVHIQPAAIDTIEVEDQGATAICAGDHRLHRFDTVYSAFGAEPQSHLAAALGAQLDSSRRLYVGEHQDTSVEGLYAVGDLVRGLNQISVANGEAAIAATAVHNRLPRNRA